MSDRIRELEEAAEAAAVMVQARKAAYDAVATIRDCLASPQHHVDRWSAACAAMFRDLYEAQKAAAEANAALDAELGKVLP